MDGTGITVDDSTDTRDFTKEGIGDPPEANGKIGKGQDFELTNTQYMTATKIGMPSALTLECWYDPESNGTSQMLFTQANASTVNLRFFRRDSGGLAFWMRTNLATMFDLVDSGTFSGMTYLTGRYVQNDYAKMYRNAVEVGSDITIGGVIQNTADAELWSGAEKITGGRYWADGIADEMRISDISRSTNWIETTYETQNDPAGFMSWGNEQIPAQGADIFYYDGINNIELQRDDDNPSPVQMFNGTTIIGLKLGATDNALASPIHVFDGTTIKAILRMP